MQGLLTMFASLSSLLRKLPKGSRSIGEIVRGLILIWKILDPEDMRNQVEFL